MMSGNLSEKLKTETELQHRSLEREFVKHIRQIKTREDYIRFLKVIYGYYKPLEEQLYPLSATVIPDYKSRRKAAWIVEDLKRMGDAASGIPLCTDLPATPTSYAALGSWYVLEGSTLGGQVICGMLVKAVADSDAGDFRFFSSYGNDTMSKWTIFKEIIDQVPSAAHAEAIEAARMTFSKFENWIQQYVF